MANNRIHEPTQSSPPSLQKVSFCREIMPIHYRQSSSSNMNTSKSFRRHQRDLSERIPFDKRIVQPKSVQSTPQRIPSKIRISSHNLCPSPRTGKRIIDMLEPHNTFHLVTLLDINMICIQQITSCLRSHKVRITLRNTTCPPWKMRRRNRNNAICPWCSRPWIRGWGIVRRTSLRGTSDGSFVRWRSRRVMKMVLLESCWRRHASYILRGSD